MKNPQLLDLYSDFLIASFTLTTAVGLSQLLDNGYSHDQISHFLAQEKLLPRDFWLSVKGLIRKIEHAYGIVVIDDTIEEKPHSTENEIVCWHWDHSKERNIKGIQLVNFLYCSPQSDGTDLNIPLAYEIIEKKEQYVDAATQKVKRRSAVSKNELVRERLRTLVQLNRVQFKYVVWDSWYSSAKNLNYVRAVLNKHFVAALKSNRYVALSKSDKLQGKFTTVKELGLETNRIYTVWLKSVDIELLLIKQVFTNQDGSNGELYLISSDIELSFDQLCTIYHKRWNVEVFHKSLKQNAALAKSPTKYEVTQSNHIFASMIAYCKLELLKCKQHLNHFALKSKLYIHAVKAAFKELQALKSSQMELNPYQNMRSLQIH